MRKFISFIRALLEAWQESQMEKQERETQRVKDDMEIEGQRADLSAEQVKTILAEAEYHKARAKLELAKKR